MRVFSKPQKQATPIESIPLPAVARRGGTSPFNAGSKGNSGRTTQRRETTTYILGSLSLSGAAP